MACPCLRVLTISVLRGLSGAAHSNEKGTDVEEQKVQGTPLGAFVVGAGISLVMQVVMVAFAAILPAEASMLATILTMVVMAVSGMALVLSGTYAKLNEIGGFGAGIMLSGLVDGMSGAYAEATLSTGDRSKGLVAASKILVFVVGPICLVGIIVGFVLGKAGFPGVMATIGDTTAMPVPLVFILSPLMGGLISIIGQCLMQYAHLPQPLVVMIEGVGGMLMGVFGVLGFLEAYCGTGLACTVVDAGGGMVAGGALLAVAGTPLRILIICAVMLMVAAFGILTGMILVRRAEASEGGAH